MQHFTGENLAQSTERSLRQIQPSLKQRKRNFPFHI